MRKLFGTDGVRGVANVEPLTAETTLKLGRTVAYLFQQRKAKQGRHCVVIGKDTRLSGYLLESALTSGICSMGVDVLLVGPMPTPALAFLTRSLRADAGVVISGSHNPYQDNGIKFFAETGFKFPDEFEQQIEELIESGRIDTIRPTARRIGKAFRVDDAEGRYIEFVKNSIPRGMEFTGLKVVIDCGHGAAYKVAPRVLRELGADVTVIGDRPNGTNINAGCGAVSPALLQRTVVKLKADIGIAHDGDADRAMFVDHRGRLVQGEQILAACALALHRRGQLKGATVVTTVMSNIGMEIALEREGIKLIRAKVGDRYVLERMLAGGFNFGGESSGHVIFLDYNTTGDGPITALQVLALMQQSGRSLAELAACIECWPQVLVNVRVARRRELSEIPAYVKLLKQAEGRLGGRGRVLVRYSGTEPLVRVMVEGEQKRLVEQLAGELAQAIERALGGRRA
ncbi:MAG: phosphoglucosamine mutase [Nitrospirota bacterium]